MNITIVKPRWQGSFANRSTFEIQLIRASENSASPSRFALPAQPVPQEITDDLRLALPSLRRFVHLTSLGGPGNLKGRPHNKVDRLGQASLGSVPKGARPCLLT
jgi:hypothetical protein